jgi:hypothetical protein
VSRSGAYFTAAGSQAEADDVEFWFLLTDADARKEVRVRCAGEVVRLEPRGTASGVEVKFTELCFEGLGAAGGLVDCRKGFREC